MASTNKQRYTLIGLAAVSVVFSFIVILLRPLWADISNFLGTAFPVMKAALVLGVTSGLFGVLGIQHRLGEGRSWPSVTAIVLIIVMAGLLTVLVVNLGNDVKLLGSQARKAIGPAIAVSFILFAVFVIPKLGLFQQPRFRLIAAGVLLLALVPVFVDIRPFRITTPPGVYIGDGGSLTVIWETNRRAQSHIEYGTDKELGLVVIPEEAGLLSLGRRIQSVTLPPLVGGETWYYRAVSRSIKGIYGNSAVFGVEKHWETLPLIVDANPDEFAFLSYSDIHENPRVYKQMAELEDFSEYDAVVLNGDLVNDFRSTGQIADHILSLNAGASSIPQVVTRGNHETRGSAARDFRDVLVADGDEFYRSFEMGGAYILVLDSGEDKEDSHKEYSGLVDFESYHERQTEWLRDVVGSDAFNGAARRVVFVHIPPLMEEDPAYMDSIYSLLDGERVDLLVAGHTHDGAILLPEDTGLDFPVVTSGGYPADRIAYVRGRMNHESLTVDLVSFRGDILSSYTAE